MFSTILLQKLTRTCLGTLWIGGIRFDGSSEPLVLTKYAEPFTNLTVTGYSFTQYNHEYVVIDPSDTGALLLEQQGSMFFPYDGYYVNGFQFDSTGRLNFNGNYNFIGCRDTPIAAQLYSYQIWFKGGGSPRNGTDCTQNLYLYAASSCNLLD